MSVWRYFEDLSVKKVSKSNSPRVSIVKRSISGGSISGLGAISRTTRTKTRSRRRLGEHISLSPFETGGRSRNQKQLPVTLRSHRGEKHADVYFTETVPFFPWVVEGTSFAWGLKKKHSAAICHSEKTPEKGIPTLIRHPPEKRTHRYWSTARDRQRSETTEKARSSMFIQACSHGQLLRVV